MICIGCERRDPFIRRAYLRDTLDRGVEWLRLAIPDASEVELEGEVVERLEREGAPRRALFELRLERASERDEARSDR